MSGLLPKVVALDLDGTVWWPEMFHLWGGGGSPFRSLPNGNVADRSGTEVTLMGATRSIIHALKTKPEWRETKLAYCSSTDEPEWARECLAKIEVGDGIPLATAAELTQIMKGNKQLHFRKIHQSSGIPYADMIFFDNEGQNIRSVETLGVVAVYCPDGLTQDIWDRGLKEYAKKHSA